MQNTSHSKNKKCTHQQIYILCILFLLHFNHPDKIRMGYNILLRCERGGIPLKLPWSSGTSTIFSKSSAQWKESLQCYHETLVRILTMPAYFQSVSECPHVLNDFVLPFPAVFCTRWVLPPIALIFSCETVFLFSMPNILPKAIESLTELSHQSNTKW